MKISLFTELRPEHLDAVATFNVEYANKLYAVLRSGVEDLPEARDTGVLQPSVTTMLGLESMLIELATRALEQIGLTPLAAFQLARAQFTEERDRFLDIIETQLSGVPAGETVQ